MKTHASTPQTSSECPQQPSADVSPQQDDSRPPITQPAHPTARHITGHPLSPKDKLIPELSDKYTLLSVLGRGTQGSVFLGESKETGHKVAIKLLNIDSVSAWKTYDLFHREVDTLSKLGIPGIARFYEAAEHLSGETPGACIVQQYIEGRTLAEMMKSGHCFSLSRIFDLALQILNILDKLHHHTPPIIHRDIKPSNLILTPSNSGFDVTLIDFGAVANPQIQSGGSTVAGTFGYMPPEQITGTPKPESDIYALGVLIVTMITGISPEDIQVKDFRLIIDPILENVPPQVVPVLRQMTEPLVSARLTDYKKLKEIFAAFAQDKYDIPSLLPVSQLPSDEFEDRLSNVRSIGQPDNIQLWQQLSEAVPRKIPENYLHLTKRDIPENHKPSGIIKLIASDAGIAIYTGLFITSIILVLFLLVLHALTLLSFFSIFFITIILTVITIKMRDFGQKRIAFCDGFYEYTKNESDFSMTYLDLLKNGRRSIATVISVKQKSLKGENAFKTYQNSSCFSVAPPAFEIKYKFNPPDDNNPDDLIRTYVSSRPANLHPGDPLPILYLIQENTSKTSSTYPTHKNKPKTVLSMPFPIPLKDFISLDRIISTHE